MKAVKRIYPLQMPWETADPFLFCVHHEDFYPKGNDHMGPDTSLAGRNIGNDFVVKDGFRMYHGSKVPGFPAHPHRGFETVTIARKGWIDHSDSLGAAGRFGQGDVQWMTAGKGVQHSEMFPLLKREEKNEMELFQIWLNLPREKKLTEPHFAMLWSEDIPVYVCEDSDGNTSEIDVIAGEIDGVSALDPAPNSWAANPENEVAIWTIKMSAQAKLTLPKASEKANRRLYFYQGSNVKLNGEDLPLQHAAELDATEQVVIENGSEESYFLFLQGRPINEPVAQYGPFVMNTQAEIQQAMNEFRTTQFGGWPWSTAEHVHDRNRGRFARFTDGKEVEKSLE
ncbi:MAG: pirin family protein [Cryomorphaceae bacterium]